MKGLLKDKWFIFTLGIVIGVAGFLIFGEASGLVNLTKIGANVIVFTNADVHLDASEDFAGGNVPVYDELYCKGKFELKYDKRASSCSVKSVETFARTNPLVREVECSCIG